MTRSPSKNPPGQRQLRIGEIVRKTIDEVLRRGEVFDARLESTPITISEVKMTPDMKQATVFFAPLGGIGADNILRALEENAAIVSACNLAQISRFSGVTFESLVFAGGGAKGALWSQILSDVTGLPVRMPEVKEATALGCAIAAGAGERL